MKTFTTGADMIVVVLLMLKLVVAAVFYPEMEMPDENAHVSRIASGSSSNLYYTLMSRASAMFNLATGMELPELQWNSGFVAYASNLSAYSHERFNSVALIFIKLLQVVLLGLFLFVLYSWLAGMHGIGQDEKLFLFRLHLLFFSWPAVGFSMTAAASDFFTYLYIPLFFYLMTVRNLVLSCLFFNLLAVRLFDNNAIPMAIAAFVFLGFALAVPPGRTLSSKAKLVCFGAVMVLLGGYALLVHSGAIGRLLPTVGPHIAYNYSLGYEPLKSMGTCFLGLYYLGGTASFRAWTVEYIVFFVLVCWCLSWLWRCRSEDRQIAGRLYVYLLACFGAFHLLLLTFPTIDQGRYYYFVLPALLVIFDRVAMGAQRFGRDRTYVLIAVLLFVSSLVKTAEAAIRSFYLN